ncbi:hypothetical protein NEUTE2DRAFT_50575 [Neurospora tetrasperma FGSC 2509]|nr:hypothetical protein NEUTE2DRAFT_50575 [Neurospora tetrasperma FGSC 2509]
MVCCATNTADLTTKNKQMQTLLVRPALAEIQTVLPIARHRFRTPKATPKSHTTLRHLLISSASQSPL